MWSQARLRTRALNREPLWEKWHTLKTSQAFRLSTEKWQEVGVYRDTSGTQMTYSTSLPVEFQTRSGGRECSPFRVKAVQTREDLTEEGCWVSPLSESPGPGRVLAASERQIASHCIPHISQAGPTY